jgi:hypothetical protein
VCVDADADLLVEGDVEDDDGHLRSKRASHVSVLA